MDWLTQLAHGRDSQPSELESVWAEVGGLRMHARRSTHPVPTDAPTVVLVHGLGVSSRYMIPTAVRLAREYRVFALDLPGFGLSDRPQRVLPIRGLANALVAWMDALRISPATFVANSMGCQVVVDVAVHHPERVESAVLVGSTVDPAARTFVQQFGRVTLDMFWEPLSLWPILAHDYLSAGLLRTARTFASALRDPLVDKLPQVQAPMLVVRGEHDPIAPQRWVEEMAGLLPRGRAQVIPGTAHATQFSGAGELTRVIQAFMQDTSPTGIDGKARPSGACAETEQAPAVR